jgi:hypothetical protein
MEMFVYEITSEWSRIKNVIALHIYKNYTQIKPPAAIFGRRSLYAVFTHSHKIKKEKSWKKEKFPLALFFQCIPPAKASIGPNKKLACNLVNNSDLAPRFFLPFSLPF